MIVKSHKIKLSIKEVKKMMAFNKGVYIDGELIFNIKHSKNTICVVYNNENIIAFINNINTVTAALYNIIEFNTEKDANIWIKNSGLTYVLTETI